MTVLAADRAPLVGGQRLVPWGTVLPLAVLLSYADGFWVTAVQAAVGSTERTSSPATAFWWWSTLLLPGFALAVLGAVHLAGRWAGAGRRATLATGAAVVAAATTAGVVAMAVSATYDYSLQSAALIAQQGVHGGCDTDCMSARRAATALAHLRGIGVGAGLMLVTNAVLVAWWAAARGGRLDLGAVGPAPAGTGRVHDLRMLLAAALAASAAIHLAVVGEHVAEWPAAGWFFLGLAVVQGGAAAGLLLGLRVADWAAAVGSAGPLLVWACSRTVGLPLGPEAGRPEAVGVPDTVVGLLELGTVLGAFALLGGWRRLSGPRWGEAARWAAVLAVVTVGALGVEFTAPVGNDGVGGGGHTEVEAPR